MLLLDILINTILVLVILFLWAVFVLFLIAAIKDLKKMPKKPEIMPIYNGNTGKWLSHEDYQALLRGESVRGKAETIAPEVYDQEENPWNERNISAKGQNNV